MNRKSIIISLSGYNLTKKEKQLILKYKPWGIILFARNIVSIKQCRNLTNEIRKLMKDNKYPILVDEEGGTVSRIKNIYNNKFSQKYFGEIYEKNQIIGTQVYTKYINRISNILIKLGININTAPVMDMLSVRTTDILKNRCYSKNINTVRKLSINCINNQKLNKIASVIKHLPGHGCTSIDSHKKLPFVNKSLQLLKETDFLCFKNIQSFFGMTSHIIYNSIDKNYPCTHSKILINKIIRKYIGFKGLLISDDISMKALKLSLVNNAKLALSSGCNLVLHCSGKSKETELLLKNLPYIDKFTKKKTSEFYKFLS